MEKYLTDLEYTVYVAKQDLYERLSDLSDKYNNCLNESTYNYLTELSLSSVGDYINKIVAGIQRAWNSFKSGYNSSMWESYFKTNKNRLSSKFQMQTPENGFTLPIFSELDKVLSVSYPVYSDNLKLESRDVFMQSQSALSYLYQENVDMMSVVDPKVFEVLEKSTVYSSATLAPYIDFMNNYGSNSDKIANDIRRLNTSVAKIKRDTTQAKIEDERNKKEAEQAKQQAKEEQEAAKQKAREDRERSANQQASDNTTPQVQTNSSVYPNIADFLIESLLIEVEEDQNTQGISNNQAQQDPTQRDYNAELEGISVYLKVGTELLSTKMKCLNKARQLSMILIKNYVNLVKQNEKENSQSKQQPQVKI